jgi:DNA repair exonuclease SbcCD ATPase subunit
MSHSARRLSWFGVMVLTVSGVATVLAQGRSDATEATSLAPLTSELRQLRVAVEELTRSQTQTQALSVYLTVQQSRMLQASNFLDAARKDLETATTRSRELTWRLGNLNDELRQAADPERRTQLEDAIRQVKHDQGTIGLQEQQARARENELSQALHVEQSRWADLISRLEQLTKR